MFMVIITPEQLAIAGIFPLFMGTRMQWIHSGMIHFMMIIGMVVQVLA